MFRFKLLTILMFTCACSGNRLSPEYSAKTDSNYRSLGIIQGSTTETTTQFSIVIPKAYTFDIQITEKGKAKNQIKTFREVKINRKHSHWSVSKIYVNNLKLGKTYLLHIKGIDNNFRDEREFKTLNRSGKKLKFLMTSCMSDTYVDVANTIWETAMTHNPEVIFLIGDNIYSDVYNGHYLGFESSPAHLWSRYVDAFNTVKLFKLKKLTPLYAIWDDHDFGVNDGNKYYRHKAKAKKMFHAFFPQNDKDNVLKGKGIGYKISLREQNFYFLDDRYFRSLPRTNGTHFGKAQTKWIFDNLKRESQISWLISGDQFFGGYHPFESFQGEYEKDFNSFIRKIKKLKSKVLFASGDRHLVELMKIPKKYLGYETYEITSSGIHTKVYPGSLKRNPNELRIAGVDGIHNFVIIETDQLEKDFKVNVTSYDKSNQMILNKTLIINKL